MICLGIDPGYERLGIALVEKENSSKEILIHSECFQTDKKLDHQKRLSLIKNRIDEILKKYKPDSLAIESLFFNVNQKTAIKVAEVRGIIISSCGQMSIPSFEYSPQKIKQAVTGNGHSDKIAVIKTVPLLVKITNKIKHDDEYDAIAVALTHLAMHRFMSQIDLHK